MYNLDQEHTSCIIDIGPYYYKVMPFGLINVGATYQQLVNMMFKDQLGKTMEIYVDDMLIICRYMADINKLKVALKSEFEMKDL